MYDENPLENPCTDYQSERHAVQRREYQELLDAEAAGDYLCQWVDQSAHVWDYEDHKREVEWLTRRLQVNEHVKAWTDYRGAGYHAVRTVMGVLRKLEPGATRRGLRSCALHDPGWEPSRTDVPPPPPTFVPSFT